MKAGARLDRLPVSKFHHRILWLIGGGMFLDGFDIHLAGGVLGALVQSGWSTLSLNAAFLSSTFAGMLVGALLAGMLGDTKGRRFTYQFNLAIFGLASLAGAFAPNMYWLIICRFFMGVGLGAEIVVAYASMAEFIPPHIRGRWAAYLSLITNTSLFCATFLGYLIIPSFLGWRTMFVIVGIGALIMWLIRKKMPESPRWLESKGRFAEAEKILAAAEAESSINEKLPSLAASAEPIQPTTLLSLFHWPLLHRTLLAMCIQVVINILLYGFILWVPTFLMKQGLGVASSLGHTAVMSLGGPAGAFLAIFLADKVGRKNGLIVTALLAALVGWFYGYSANIKLATCLGFILFTLTYVIVTFGLAAYIPELFATENRMRANGVAGCVGRIAGIIAPPAVVALYASGGIQNVLSVIIGTLIAMAIVLALFGIETNGRSLEDISPN